MDYTQNIKIAQVTEKTLVVGVDIGSETNFARAFNWRGQELSKKAFHFSNSLEGFQGFLEYLGRYRTITSAEQIIVGCEPTGHYWFNLARYLNQQHISLTLVNPYHVKQIKEFAVSFRRSKPFPKENCSPPRDSSNRPHCRLPSGS